MSHKKGEYSEIAKATKIFGSSQIAILISNILRTKFVAIFLGASGYGILSLYQSSITLISTFSNLGIGTMAIKEIAASYGGIDILVNNAGITRDNLLMRMKESEWQDIMDTNLTAIFTLSKAVLRGMMKKRFGRIVNIGSVVGSSGNAGQANYAAAKAGVIGFSKSMAREVASRGITINVVAPGFIDTDMTKALSDDQREAISKDIPANRLGEPEEIAATVAFLVSDGAAYITGETIHVNGGMYMG